MEVGPNKGLILLCIQIVPIGFILRNDHLVFIQELNYEFQFPSQLIFQLYLKEAHLVL